MTETRRLLKGFLIGAMVMAGVLYGAYRMFWLIAMLRGIKC